MLAGTVLPQVALWEPSFLQLILATVWLGLVLLPLDLLFLLASMGANSSATSYFFSSSCFLFSFQSELPLCFSCSVIIRLCVFLRGWPV